MPKAANESDIGVRIGQNIRSARTRQGLTQGQLAEALGVETVTMSRIETGAQQPSIGRLQQIANVLGMSLAALVVDHGDSSDTLTLLAEVFRELPTREQDFLREFILTYSRHWKSRPQNKPD